MALEAQKKNSEREREREPPGTLYSEGAHMSRLCASFLKGRGRARSKAGGEVQVRAEGLGRLMLATVGGALVRRFLVSRGSSLSFMSTAAGRLQGAPPYMLKPT